MREKLEKIIDAYEELEQKLGDPQVLANQHEYNKLAMLTRVRWLRHLANTCRILTTWKKPRKCLAMLI